MKLFNIIYSITLNFFAFNAYGNCNTQIPQDTPKERFESDSKGIVVDNISHLMWMTCSNGQQFSENKCSGSTAKVNWVEALTLADRTSFGGFDDWRLPNKNELNSIIELSCEMPAVNSVIFPGTASLEYWTSSPYLIESRYIWTINFSNGNIFINDAAQELSIRLVRDIK